MFYIGSCSQFEGVFAKVQDRGDLPCSIVEHFIGITTPATQIYINFYDDAQL